MDQWSMKNGETLGSRDRPRIPADTQLITLPEAKADAPEGSVPVLDLSHLGKFKLVSQA